MLVQTLFALFLRQKMYQVYILKSLNDLRTYAGYTKDVAVRLEDHNTGKVKATKKRLPFEIVYIENTKTLKFAKQRELYWKSGAGRRKLKHFFRVGFPPIKDGRGSPKF